MDRPIGSTLIPPQWTLSVSHFDVWILWCHAIDAILLSIKSLVGALSLCGPADGWVYYVIAGGAPFPIISTTMFLPPPVRLNKHHPPVTSHPARIVRLPSVPASRPFGDHSQSVSDQNIFVVIKEEVGDTIIGLELFIVPWLTTLPVLLIYYFHTQLM
jgi:hypothetical protein